MFVLYLKQALRGMRKNTLFSVINIFGFASGFAVCMILALFAYSEYTVDECYDNYSNIYRLIDTKKNGCRIDYDVAGLLQDRFQEIKSAVPVNYVSFSEPIYMKKESGDDYILLSGLIGTTNNFFSIFGLKTIYGSPEKPFENDNSVVLTESTAERLFGRTDVAGEVVNISNFLILTVSAVVENLPGNSSLNADLFINIVDEKYRFSKSCSDYNKCYYPNDIYIELNDFTDAGLTERKINSAFPGNKSGTDSISLQRLNEIYLTTGIEGNRNEAGNRGLIRIFLLIALLIMVLSVINYINYTLSKQLTTLKETGVKIANGAGERQIINYFIVDAALSVIISFLLAMGITDALLPYAGAVLDTTLTFNLLFSYSLTFVFIAVIIIVIILSSLAPALIISRYDVQRLFGKRDVTKGRQTGRKILTVFQMAISLILLISLLVIVKQLHYVRTTDLGFNVDHLLRIDLPDDEVSRMALKQEADQCSFVTGTSFSQGGPGSVFIYMDTNTGDDDFNLACIYVDENFLNIFGINLIQGRGFLGSDFDRSCILNEAAYKRYGWDDLENRKFNNGSEDGYNVIGVVEDFNVASLHNSIEPVCLICRGDYSFLNVRLSPGDLVSQLKSIRDVWDKIYPAAPMMYTFYDQYFDAFYKKEEGEARAIAIFAVIALIITCLGLFGQVFQTCQNKTKEIGIRRVNGASAGSIVVMLSKSFALWLCISFVIASSVTYIAMSKWLEHFNYKTSLDWWLFALAGILSAVIVLLTVGGQSWTAATKNPVEALRYE